MTVLLCFCAGEDEIVREMTRVFQKQGIDYELTLTTQVFAWNDTLDFAIFSILTLAVALLVAMSFGEGAAKKAGE